MTLKKWMAGLMALAVVASLFGPPPAAGITIKEEEELGREFLTYLNLQMEIIDDPLIVAYVNSIGKKILAKVPPQPFPYHFYVVDQQIYNAFATPAGHVFIYSGLMAAMDNEDELAGILAHEISHVTARHISQKIERSKLISIATLAGVAAGMLLGAAGGGQAAGALTMGSMAAGQSASLAFSRENEVQADQIGMGYLTDA
ncbi:MAG: M48 family metallopeptidase, partial [Desulfobacterales bacterium]